MKFASISAFGLAMALNASIATALSTCAADSHFGEEANVGCINEFAKPIGYGGEQKLDSAYINVLPLEGNKLKGFVPTTSDWMKSGESIVCHYIAFFFEHQTHSLFLE
jgi:hypothetical protein